MNDHDRSAATLSKLLQIGRERVSGWNEPAVNDLDDGGIVEAEWWNDAKTLIVTVDRGRVSMVRMSHDCNQMAENREGPVSELFVEWCGWLCAS